MLALQNCKCACRQERFTCYSVLCLVMSVRCQSVIKLSVLKVQYECAVSPTTPAQGPHFAQPWSFLGGGCAAVLDSRGLHKPPNAYEQVSPMKSWKTLDRQDAEESPQKGMGVNRYSTGCLRTCYGHAYPGKCVRAVAVMHRRARILVDPCQSESSAS